MLTVSKLSKLQKAILEFLHTKNDRPVHYMRFVSQHIAETFNKGNRDRIINRQIQRAECMADETDEFRRATLDKLLRHFETKQRKKNVLTPKHRASFSRSVKRLKERGLVEGFPNTRQETIIDKSIPILGMRWVIHPVRGEGRERYVGLTEKGKELCGQLFGD